MTDHPIPAASQQRLAAAYGQFQELAKVIVEAMGLADREVRLELERGVIVELTPGEQLAAAPNGQVAQEVT